MQGSQPVEPPAPAAPGRSAQRQLPQPAARSEPVAPTLSVPPRATQLARRDVVKGAATGKAVGTSKAGAVGAATSSAVGKARGRTIVIGLAPALRGRANRLTQLRAKLPLPLRVEFGALLDEMIDERRRAGCPPTKVQAARLYLKQQLATGRELTPALRRETMRETKCSQPTISRAVELIQKGF
jgi:hypothetical protein